MGMKVHQTSLKILSRQWNWLCKIHKKYKPHNPSPQKTSKSCRHKYTQERGSEPTIHQANRCQCDMMKILCKILLSCGQLKPTNLPFEGEKKKLLTSFSFTDILSRYQGIKHYPSEHTAAFLLVQQLSAISKCIAALPIALHYSATVKELRLDARELPKVDETSW